MRFILGPLVIILGVLLMKYTVQITDFTGRIDFAEKYLTAGLGAGTYTWWRLVGLCFAILGAMWILGLTSLLGEGLVSILGLR